MSHLPLVLVTGSSGFIASHVVAGLLEEKKYRVRGTVRSLANESVITPLKEAFPELELVEADLTKDSGWKEAVEGCEFVHHVASPFPFGSPLHRDELFRPAIDGTKRVLQACVDAGTVKRVVLTSSIAAVSTGLLGNKGCSVDYVYTPSDWTDPDSPRCPLYEASKTHAEKAAWEFVEKLEEGKKLELVTILPAAVFGPLILHRPSTSHSFIVSIMKRVMYAIPDVNVPFVDVRDVRKAHVIAMTKEGAPGSRYILWSHTAPLKEIAQVLAKEFNSQGYRVPVGHLSKVALWFGKFFDPKAKLIYGLLGCKTQYDITKLKEELGIEPIGVEESTIESAHSLIEKQLIPRMGAYKGRQG